MKRIIYLAIVALLFTLTACGISKEEIESEVAASIQETLDTDKSYREHGMEVMNLRLFNEIGNKYKGRAEIDFMDESHSVVVNVIADNEGYIWEIPRMEFSFVAEYELDKALKDAASIEEVFTNTPNDSAANFWTVVVGSFGVPGNAERLVTILENMSFQAYILEDDDKDIVIVGHADHEDAAYELKDKLLRDAEISGMVVSDIELQQIQTRRAPPNLLKAPNSLN